MKVKIIENFVESKTKNKELCEDCIYIGERFYAIIDGATSKSNFSIEGKTTGKLASELIFYSLNCLDSYKGELSFHDIQYKINNTFSNSYEKHFKNNQNEKMIAAAVIFDSYDNVVYLVGDCQILIIKNGEEIRVLNEAKINQIMANKRAHFNINLIKNGEATTETLMERDLGREFIFEELKQQYKLINNLEHKHGFFVFDGSEIPDNKVVKIPVGDIDGLILASDGYPKIFNSLDKTEEYLSEIITLDPLLIHKFRSTKGINKDNNSFDDRSYLKLKINK